MRNLLIAAALVLSLAPAQAHAKDHRLPPVIVTPDDGRAAEGLCARNPADYGPCPKVNRKNKGNRAPLPPQE